MASRLSIIEKHILSSKSWVLSQKPRFRPKNHNFVIKILDFITKSWFLIQKLGFWLCNYRYHFVIKIPDVPEIPNTLQTSQKRPSKVPFKGSQFGVRRANSYGILKGDPSQVGLQWCFNGALWCSKYDLGHPPVQALLLAQGWLATNPPLVHPSAQWNCTEIGLYTIVIFRAWSQAGTRSDAPRS
jgi:hypothetical protein